MEQKGPVRKQRIAVLLVTVLALAVFGVATSVAAPDTRFVDGATGTDSGNCIDPTAPCQTIGYAVSQAGMDDEIHVTGGTYVENVKLLAGIPLTVRGGYVIEDGVWIANGDIPTVIDGNDTDSVIEIRNGSDSVIEDLTVTGGRGLDDPTFGNGCGGFKIQSADVTIRRVSIIDNSAGSGDGGGVCAAGDDGQMTLLIEDSVVSGNRSQGTGGGFQLFNTKTTIVNSLITDNASGSNVANVMLVIMDDDVTIINSTVADNNPSGDQAVHVFSGAVTVVNSIFVNNALNFQADPPCPSCFDISYSLVQGWTGGTGNIDEQPAFVDAANGNYRLTMDSPAVDAGTPAGAPVADLDGNPRDAMPDMGAYEYIPNIIYLPATTAP